MTGKSSKGVAIFGKKTTDEKEVRQSFGAKQYKAQQKERVGWMRKNFLFNPSKRPVTTPRRLKKLVKGKASVPVSEKYAVITMKTVLERNPEKVIVTRTVKFRARHRRDTVVPNIRRKAVRDEYRCGLRPKTRT